MSSVIARPVVEVQRKLQHAADQQLAKVLALVDAMPARGAADALIAPLRPRLAAIEPARPMSLTRLLFRPLDPVIFPGSQWRPGMPAVPRTALPSIGQELVARLGSVLNPVRAMIAGQDGKNQAIVAAAGSVLWPAAAVALLDLPIPEDWGVGTGLPEGCYTEIRASIAAVLHQAVPLGEISQDTARADPAPAIRRILAATQASHPGGMGVVMAVLLARDGAAAPVMLVALGAPGPQVDRVIEQTLDRAQHVMATLLPSVGLAAAAHQVMHVAALLEAMDSPNARPTLRAEVQRIRQVADQACCGRLIQALDEEFLPKLADTTAILDDAAVEALEAAARGLRRLSVAGRRLGSGSAYDKLLGQTATGACASVGTLTRMERLRVAELLVGSDAALNIMRKEDEPALG